MKLKLFLLALLGILFLSPSDTWGWDKSHQWGFHKEAAPGVYHSKFPQDTLRKAGKKARTINPARTIGPRRPLTRSSELQKQMAALAVKYHFNRQKALRLAEKYHWPLQGQQPDGATISLQGLDEAERPHYYVSYNNLAASNTRTNLLWIGNRLGYHLSGAGTHLSGRLGVWDGGRVRNTHRELVGRVVQQDNPFALDDHATHVSGTLIASGVLPAARGMAFGAELKAWDYDNDTPEIAAAASGLLVSNYSYGSLCGWRSTGRGWEWWGEPSLNETYDWKFGYYTISAREWDQIAFQAPYYLMVKSAGNNRNANGPPAGTSYFIANSNVTSRLARSRNDGYDLVTTNGTAKNILTIGAANPMAYGYNHPSDVVIASFSSWGPTDDGRIKPDLVGIGVNVLSSGADNDQDYFAGSGTSMSGPNVAGSLFLLQEYYARLNQGNFMRSATLKGLALHTAHEAGHHPGPDYVFGWGLLNAEKAAGLIGNRQGEHLLQERQLVQNQTYTFLVTASGKGPLEATICWTDPEGSVPLLTPQAVNNRTPKLVNDLDLRISQENHTYLPWTLDPDNPSNPAIPGDNIRDNVEKVWIPDAVPGKTYLISISHKGNLQRGPQAYALIVSGVGGNPYCTSRPLTSAGARIDQFTLGSFQNTTPGTCTTYSDFTHLTVPVTTGQTLAMSLTLGSCDTPTGKIGQVFVDWNGDADFSDAGELIATTPVLGGAETFQTPFTVPPGIRSGHTSRLRIVCAETSNADGVGACGTYASGETQDYRLSFQPPAKDVGMVDLNYPAQGFCANPEAGGVTVTVRNLGTAAQTHIPVTVHIRTDNDALAGTLRGTLTGTLYPGNEAPLVLQGSFPAETGKRYVFLCRTGLSGDADPSNDLFTATRNASNGTSVPTLTATICGGDPTVLKGTGNGTLFWYDAPAGGNLLAVGHPAFTTFRPPNLRYYAALNDFSGKVGPAGKAVFSGGSYGQHPGEMTFTTQVPLVLERARLFVGANGGKITCTVKNQQGHFVSATTLDVVATRNPAVSGEAGDNADDTGAEYYLNLRVPAAGTYTLSIAYEGGATLFRSHAGVAGYPFSIPGVVAITGSTSGNSTYPYLYDLRVKALGCASPRVSVVAQVSTAANATLHPAGPIQFCRGDSIVLRANRGAGLSYQWQKSGVPIAAAIRDSLVVKESGLFAVNVTSATGCRSISPEADIRVNDVTPVAVRIVPQVSPHRCSTEAIYVPLKAVTDLDPALFSFQWQRNGQNIPQANQMIYVATDTGSYTVAVSRPVCRMSTALPLRVTQEDIRLRVTPATLCGSTGSAHLFAQANKGTLFWYDAPTEGNLLATGNHFVAPALGSDQRFFVSVNEFSGTVPSPAYQTGGSFSSTTSRKVYFHAHVPFVLEKATLNVGSAGTGQRTVQVDITDQNFSNQVIASTIIRVSPGVAEYPLNLYVPDAGENYGLQISAFGGGTEVYATTHPAAIGYPYFLPGVVTIAGHNAPAPQHFYGYLYGWKVKASGCASAGRQEVTVKVLPGIPPSASLSSNSPHGIQSICEGQQATLRVDLQGTPPWSLTYTQGKNPVTIRAIAQSPHLLPVREEGTYTLLSVTDSQACSNGPVSGTARVQVLSPPSDSPGILAGGPVSFCLGESVRLTASAGFDNYRWSTGEITRTILIQQSGHYTVAGGTNNCFGPSSPPVSVSAHSLAEPPAILASGPLHFCTGDSVRLSAPAGYGLYSWSTGATSRSITVRNSGQYRVKVGHTGCVSADSSPVTVSVSDTFPPKPEITTLGKRLSSSSPDNNQWLKDGHPIPGATGQTYAATSSGQYAVKVTQSFCSTLSDGIAMVVTGIESGVRLFPNPGHRTFTVQYVSSQSSTRITATLSSTLGVEVRKMPLTLTSDGWQAVFDTGNLAAGMYFVKITDGHPISVRNWIKE